MISQTAEYSLRAMAYLADQMPQGYRSTIEVATATKVPTPYLSKVLKRLVDIGLLKGQRGPGGGFLLMRTPELITVWDVVDAVEPIKRGLPSIRKSLYVDYYSNSLKPYQNLDLPFAKIWFDHPTTFRLNSILDYLNPKNINYIKGNIKYQYNKLTAN